MTRSVSHLASQMKKLYRLKSSVIVPPSKIDNGSSVLLTKNQSGGYRDNHTKNNYERTRNIVYSSAGLLAFSFKTDQSEFKQNDRDKILIGKYQRQPAFCESESLRDRPFETQSKSYVGMFLKRGIDQREKENEYENEDDRIYGRLEDVDPSWALNPKQLKKMAIAQINANEQLEDRSVLQPLHTISNGELLLAGVMDGHGGWQVGMNHKYIYNLFLIYIYKNLSLSHMKIVVCDLLSIYYSK